MVKIRYAELPGGTRARIDRGHGGSRVTIILTPHMTPPQRRAMLNRLIRNSRLPGYGPRLSSAGVALALGWDVTRTAVRTHPVQSLIGSGCVAAAATCLMLFVSVTVHLGPANPPPLAAAQGGPPVIRIHARRLTPRPRPDGPAPAPGAVVPVSATRPAASQKATEAAPQPLATSPVPLSPSPSPDPVPSTTAATPAPTPTGGSGAAGACLQLGPLGVCVGV